MKNNKNIININEQIQLSKEQLNKIQLEINKLKRKSNITNSISNHQNEYASSAKIAEELSDGIQRVTFNNINKSVVFRNNNTPISNCIQINSKENSINNVNSINFTENNSKFSGLTNDFEINESNNYAPTITAINNKFLNYADKIHTHNISDITNLQTTLENKSNINHNHNSSYILLNNIVNEINSIEENTDSNKIPNIIAIRNYCQDFLTPTKFQNNSQLVNLLKGKSAFEIWKENQPIRYNEEEEIIEYTYNDFITAISGYDGIDGNDGVDGVGFLEWYCYVRNKDINNISWEEICTDIFLSAMFATEQQDEEEEPHKKTWQEKLMEAFEIIDGVATVVEGGGEVGLVEKVSSLQTQVAALQAEIVALQSQIFVVQGAVGSILSSTVTDETLDTFDEIVDSATDALNDINGNNSSSIFDGIKNFANKLSSRFKNLNPDITSANSTVSNSVLHSSLLGAGEVL